MLAEAMPSKPAVEILEQSGRIGIRVGLDPDLMAFGEMAFASKVGEQVTVVGEAPIAEHAMQVHAAALGSIAVAVAARHGWCNVRGVG